jgi:hypothetical protein
LAFIFCSIIDLGSIGSGSIDLGSIDSGSGIYQK